MHPDISVNIGKLKLKNPVMVASGTFGYAEELKDLLDLREIGAIVTKTITLMPRKGNPAPRTCETPAGMLNSIGLENPGLDKFLKEKFPFLVKLGVPIIISVAGQNSLGELLALCSKLDKIRDVAALELNISCPNLGGAKFKIQNAKLISQDAQATCEVVKAVRRVTTKVLITKLSPNVTDIVEIAQAAEKAGSDAVSLVNTFSALSINIKSRRPKIASGIAGLSGPAIRPIAVRMVNEVYRKVKLPIIGMGGIIDTASALEFFIAGATAISVGTANFINPKVSLEIIEGIKKYLQENNINCIKRLTGALKCKI